VLLSHIEGYRFNLEEINIDSFLAQVVFAVISHNFELETNDEPVLGILEELLGQVSLLHVIKVEEQVFRVNVRHDETVVLALIEELQSPRYFVLKVVRITLVQHVLLDLLLRCCSCILRQHVLVLLEDLGIQSDLINSAFGCIAS
jgi:hypothetical protein